MRMMKMIVEIFKKIDGYPNYKVSNHGRVRNDKFNRILKPRITTNGYHKVDLYKNNKAKTHKVHRLVAITFIPNPDDKPEVDHIDKNRTNIF